MSTYIPQIIKQLDATRDMLHERTGKIHHHLPFVIKLMRHSDAAVASNSYDRWEHKKYRELFTLLLGATRSQYVFATLLKVAASDYLEPCDFTLGTHKALRKRIKQLLRHVEDKCLEAEIRSKELAKLKEGMYDEHDDDEGILLVMQNIMDGKIDIYGFLEVAWTTLRSKASLLKILTKEPPILGQPMLQPAVSSNNEEYHEPAIDSSASIAILAGSLLDMSEQGRMNGLLAGPLSKQTQPTTRPPTPEPAIPDSHDDEYEPSLDLPTLMTTTTGAPLDMNEQRRTIGFFMPIAPASDEPPSDSAPVESEVEQLTLDTSSSTVISATEGSITTSEQNVRPPKRSRSGSPSGLSPPTKRICSKRTVQFNEVVNVREIPARGDEEEYVDEEMRFTDPEEDVLPPETGSEGEVMPEIEL